MVRCADCGFEGCDVAYTGNIGEEQCCRCWLKTNPTSDVGGCKTCNEREKIHNQQVSLEKFI